MGRRKPSPFYCVFFSPRARAAVGTRFFLDQEEVRAYANKRLRYHLADQKAYVYTFDSIPVHLDAKRLPTSQGFRKDREKLYLTEVVYDMMLDEVIERTQDELIALVERRMTKRG